VGVVKVARELNRMTSDLTEFICSRDVPDVKFADSGYRMLFSGFRIQNSGKLKD